jgi:prolyl-tRNA synthetase
MYSKEEVKKLHLKFWELFGKRCEIHPQLQDRRRKWLLHRTKIKGVALRFEVGRKNAKVILELGHRNEELRLKGYEILERYKAIIEAGFENGLTWEFYHQREDSQQEVCRVYAILENVDIHRQNQWPDIYNFFIENMLLLEENFLAVRDILKEELHN